jgi:methylated-DNA-[protein]-cysteine S-methyltransferase
MYMAAPPGMQAGSRAGRAGRTRRGLHYRLFDTAIGACGIAWSAHGVTRLQLPESDPVATEKRLRAGIHFAAAWAGEAETPAAIAQVIADIRRYLSGERVDFTAVALDLSDAGAFHRRVYEAVRSVGWGETMTYAELAQRAGSPGAARAVGQALSQNPIAVVIPCHRVLASDGGLGGFSAHGGVAAKERLLELEGTRSGGARWLTDR